MPISHGEGKYHADVETLRALRQRNQIVFRYATADGKVTKAANPNGSLDNIAGIVNEEGTVLGAHAAPRAGGRVGHGRHRRAAAVPLAPRQPGRGRDLQQALTCRGRAEGHARPGARPGPARPTSTIASSSGSAASRPTPSSVSSRRSGPSTAPTSTRESSCDACPRPVARVLQGPGENAGAVDIGDGWAVVFKIESHNHPSFIEPFQGAATGVGGILRDIFTMGARPDRAARLAALRRSGRSAHAATHRRAWCPASRGTATASGARRWAARSPSRPSTPATRW